MRSEKIFGIYTPLEWHNKSKPSLKKMAPFRRGCNICRQEVNRAYQKWWREKQKLLKS